MNRYFTTRRMLVASVLATLLVVRAALGAPEQTSFATTSAEFLETLLQCAVWGAALGLVISICSVEDILGKRLSRKEVVAYWLFGPLLGTTLIAGPVALFGGLSAFVGADHWLVALICVMTLWAMYDTYRFIAWLSESPSASEVRKGSMAKKHPLRGQVQIDVTPSGDFEVAPVAPTSDGRTPPRNALLAASAVVALAAVAYLFWLPTSISREINGVPSEERTASAAPSQATGSPPPTPTLDASPPYNSGPRRPVPKPRATRSSPVWPSLASPDDDGADTVFVPQFIEFRGQRRLDSDRPTRILPPSSLVFAYDRIQVIKVVSLAEIPEADRDRALAWESQGNQFRESVIPSDTTHIIRGDVEVTVGDLYGTDSLSVRAAIEDHANIRQVELVLSHAPRGPPAAALVPRVYQELVAPELAEALNNLNDEQRRRMPRALAVAGWVRPPPGRPLRTVYVVGSIKNFRGPDQYNQSELVANILDLTPRERNVPEFNVVTREHPSFSEVIENRSELWKLAPPILAAVAGLRRGSQVSPRPGPPKPTYTPPVRPPGRRGPVRP